MSVYSMVASVFFLSNVFGELHHFMSSKRMVDCFRLTKTGKTKIYQQFFFSLYYEEFLLISAPSHVRSKRRLLAF